MLRPQDQFPHNRVGAAKKLLLSYKPWWGPLLNRMPVVPISVPVPTDGEYGGMTSTDQDMRLYIDTAFATAAPLELLAGSIERELQRHIRDTWNRFSWLAPDEWDRQVNICIDLEIASSIKREYQNIPRRNNAIFSDDMAERWSVTGPPSLENVGWTPDKLELEDGLSAEQYYRLMNQPPPSAEQEPESSDESDEPQDGAPDGDGSGDDQPEQESSEGNDSPGESDEEQEGNAEQGDSGEEQDGEGSQESDAEQGGSGDSPEDGDDSNSEGDSDASGGDGSQDEDPGDVRFGKQGEDSQDQGSETNPGDGEPGDRDPSDGGEPSEESEQGTESPEQSGGGKQNQAPDPQRSGGGQSDHSQAQGEDSSNQSSSWAEAVSNEAEGNGAPSDLDASGSQGSQPSTRMDMAEDMMTRSPEMSWMAQDLQSPRDPLEPTWEPDEQDQKQPMTSAEKKEALNKMADQVKDMLKGTNQALRDDYGDLESWAEQEKRKRPDYWTSQLSRLASMAADSAQIEGSSDLTYQKRNPNQPQVGPVLMGMIDYSPTIYTLNDQSYSMVQDDGLRRSAQTYLDLTKSLFSRYGDTALWIGVDTQIRYVGKPQSPRKIARNELPAMFAMGGTDFEDVIRDIVEGKMVWEGRKYKKPDLLIINTDCKFDWPWHNSPKPPRGTRIIVCSVIPYEQATNWLPRWVGPHNRNFIEVDPR